MTAVDSLRWLRFGGLAAWLGVGVPLWLQREQVRPGAVPGWLAAWLLFAVALWATTSGRSGRPWSRRAVLALLAVQAISVLALVLQLCDGFEGTLLVVVAMQLAPRVSRRAGLAWIAVQSLLLASAVAVHWSLRPALLLAPPYLGFQILAFLAVEALDGERRANAELRAARDLLAHGSRLAERLRIARELHDAVGHRLVALSLNLERAAHQAPQDAGEAREAVVMAQSLARRVLTDIGEIVDTLGRAEPLDLRQALLGLRGEIPRPRIHLSLPAELAVADPELAHLLLRCCQEIVTNAAKHAQAKNLWLEVMEEDGVIGVRARDDGRGAAAAADAAAGRGLTGMRERLERAGGRLEVVTRPGEGFAVAASVPWPGGSGGSGVRP
jgi:signal transduction histidine kinase